VYPNICGEQAVAGAEQAAEKWREGHFQTRKTIPQGLKPAHSIGLIGTTEVVPLRETLHIEFSAACKARIFPGLFCGTTGTGC
jgi:hypothetical protein